MRWRLGLGEYGPRTERELERKLSETIAGTEKLDAAVVLAFDAVHDPDGRMDETNTHLYVTNDYVIELARKYPKVLLGASVHPYRKDAVAEVERCVKAGAVLLKWLPNTQCFNPSDERCIPFYEALAHHKLVHGSDWPILPVPPLRQVGLGASLGLWREKNWLRRDVRIKQRMGMEDAYWHRAAKVLRVER